MDHAESRKAVPLSHLVAGGATLVLGWALLNLAPAFYLLHWRVANEPGAGPGRGLLITSIVLAVIGASAFLGANVFLLVRRFKAALLAWLLCVGVTVGAIALSPILLLLLV